MPELGRLSWSLFGLLFFVLSHEAGAKNSLFPFPVLEDAPALQAIIRKGRSSFYSDGTMVAVGKNKKGFGLCLKHQILGTLYCLIYEYLGILTRLTLKFLTI
jgi:hypothetical protein